MRFRKSCIAAAVALGMATPVTAMAAPIPGLNGVEVPDGALDSAASLVEQAGGMAADTGLPGVTDLGSAADLAGATVEHTGVSGKVHGGKNIVSFGDSYFADSSSPGAGGKCGQSPENPPNLMGKKLGLPVDDYSCSGATANDKTGNTFARQVDLALKHKTLSPETKFIAISMGGNDGIAGFAAPAEIQKSQYQDAMAAQIKRIRDAAPNARILQVGYPEVIGEDGMFCPLHTSVLPNMVNLPGGDAIRQQEQTINAYQKEVADKLDIEFIDLKNSTKGHGVCANDTDRWVSGYLDGSNQNTYTMPLHLTNAANEHISTVLAEVAKTGKVPESSGSEMAEGGALDPEGLQDTLNNLPNALTKTMSTQ